MSGMGEAAREASDYFNSLPIEERRRLAPLLEDYRRMGIEEAQRRMHQVATDLAKRARSITEDQDWGLKADRDAAAALGEAS